MSPSPQVIVAERGPLVWVFNFSPFNDYEGFKVRPPAASGAAYIHARIHGTEACTEGSCIVCRQVDVCLLSGQQQLLDISIMHR